MRLAITDTFRPRTDAKFVERVVQAVLSYVHRDGDDMEVSLLLTDDAEIARVHGEFLGDPTPTDVISFDLDGTAELVVSVECAQREAEKRGHALRSEVALYIVHGLLHVCGYDDIDDEDRKRMRIAERDVLQLLGESIASVDE